MLARMGTEEPTPEEIRAALERVVASDVFRRAPQLTAFLRFVVEAALKGEADRIKGYTIATEALGRAGNFDPETDPIVRIEAGRLRRALERYYTGEGASDAILIDIARGGYVPTFRRRLIDAADAPALAPPKPDDVEPPAGRAKTWQAPSIPLPITGLLVLAAAALMVLLWLFWPVGDRGRADFRQGNGLPLVTVRPVEVIGSRAASAAEFEGLRRRLADALARFDGINVSADSFEREAAPRTRRELRGGPTHYQLVESVEFHGDGSLSLGLALLDGSDGTTAWSRSFHGTPAGLDQEQVENAIVRAVAGSIAQPFGVIHAREQTKTGLDPRHACLLEAIDYWRSFDISAHERVRACLERLVQLDPAFAAGFAALETVYERGYFDGSDLSRADAAPLDRAVAVAQRAVALKPQSAWAHAALESAYFARADVSAALAEGETALSLNPLDPLAVITHGQRLILTGEIDKGVSLLRAVTQYNIGVNSNLVNFYLFLAAYLKDDRESLARQVNLNAGDRDILGAVARVLVGRDNPDVLARLRDDPRRALVKFIPAPDVVDRLVRDLAARGAR